MFPRIKHAHRTAGFFKIRGVNLGHQDLEDFMFRHRRDRRLPRRGDERGRQRLPASSRSKCAAARDAAAICRAPWLSQMKQKFELTPQIVVLETGTLAKEFEANVKAARFVDRRG